MLKNVLAFVAVRDIEDGIRRYKMLLGRGPETQPMPGLAEWRFEAGGWLQVNENKLLEQIPLNPSYIRRECQSAFKFGSDSLLMQFEGCLAF